MESTIGDLRKVLLVPICSTTVRHAWAWLAGSLSIGLWLRDNGSFIFSMQWSFKAVGQPFNKKSLPVHRPGGLKRADWDFFS